MKYTVMKYLRISSEDIDLDGLDKYESNSIVHQRALLDDFIAKMSEFDGCEILEASDDGRTGTNFNRPGVQEVLDLAQRGKIHCIVVKDLSRFGRNYLEVGDYLEQIFPAWGVRFVTVTDMYDSAQFHGTTGGINIAFRNLIASLYSQDLSEKVRSAKTSLNMSGKTSAPYGFYGYVIDPNDRHKLIIDEPAAEIVRLIYDLREQGLSTLKIARKFNEDGIQTANDRKQEQGAKRGWLRSSKVSFWDTGFITRILADERYTGKHIYGKHRRIELGKKAVKAVPKSEWIVVPDVFPAIISEEQFRRVREIMSASTRAIDHKSPNQNLIFFRKMFCGHCRRALERRKSRDGHNYFCKTRNMVSDLDCMRGSISEKAVIETVLTVVKLQAQLADNIKMLNAATAKSSSVTINELRAECQSLQRLIDKANSTKLTLWENKNAGNLSREAFTIESAKLSSQAKAYTEKIAELEAEIRRLEMESGQENVFVERFSKQVNITELTRVIVDEFVEAIHVYAPDRIEVTLNYVDEFEKLQAFTESNNHTGGIKIG